jgi:hypothetical protein
MIDVLTGALPRAKKAPSRCWSPPLRMMLQSLISLLVIALLAARAVNML